MADEQWFTPGNIRRLAVAADADPRTVVKYLKGERVKGMVAERIRRAAIARGIPLKDAPAVVP